MSNIKLLKNELKILFKQKTVIASILLIVSCMIMGINSINNSNSMSLHNIKRTSTTISFGTAQYGVMLGSLLFAVLTVLLLSKDRRSKSKDIIKATSNSNKLTAIRILSLVLLAIATILLGLVIILIFQSIFFKIPIEITTYLYTYSILLLPPILYSILIVSGIYLMSNSIDISILTFGALYFMGTFSSNYLLQWVKPAIPVFSDFAGFEAAGKLIFYCKVLWLFLSISIFIIGLLCTRNYSMNLYSSFKLNIKYKVLPSLLIACILVSVIMFSSEPYLTKYERVLNESEYLREGLILKSMTPKVEVFPDKGAIAGKVIYELENSTQEQSINFMTNEGLTINELLVNGLPAEYTYLDNTSILNILIPKDKSITISITYNGSIKHDSPNGYAGYISKDSIYLLECSYWIFRPLTSTAKVVDTSGSIIAPKNITLVTPGQLENSIENNSTKTWQYSLQSSSIDLGLFGGDYIKKDISCSVPIEFYYSNRHEQYINDMNIEKYIKSIADFYVSKFGDYYSQDFPLKIVETSIYKPGGHSSINVVSIAEYILNREVKKSDIATSQFSQMSHVFYHDMEILAHEISHQWWGSGIDAIQNNPWSNEGLANYSAYKYLNYEFGEQVALSAKSLWEYYVSDVSNRYFIRHPEATKNLNKMLKTSLEMESIKMQLYSKMPLMLLKGEEILGEQVFINKLSEIYKNHLNGEISYDSFLIEMNLTKEAISYE